jgi:membrane protein
VFFNKIRKNLFVRAFINLLHNGGLEYAGYLAYLNLFSLFPLFMILGVAIGVIADSKVSAEFIKIILSHIPQHSGLINNQIQAIINGPSVGILSFASIGALWTTTSSLEGMRTIFNKIYRVKSPPFFVRTRLLSILQFLVILIILITTIFGLIIFPKILLSLEHFFRIKNIGELNFEPYSTSRTIVLLIMFALVAAAYYTFTNERVTLLSVLPGSAITTIAWTISAKIMSLSLAQQLEQMSLVYGSLNSILSVLLFFYVANVILLYGAEFNYVFGKRYT